jgi:hypothetical protein
MLYPEDLSSGGLIWLKYERVYGTIVNMGAYYSTVSFHKNGIDYEVVVENDEFYFVEEEDD